MKAVGWLFPVGFVAAALWLFFWTWGANILHWFTTGGRELLPFGFFITVAIVAVVWAFVSGEKSSIVPLLVLVAIGSVIAAICMASTATYNRLNAYYNETIQFEENTLADNYKERAPYEVAVSVSTRSMMNTAGEAQIPKSLSDVGEWGEWNALINARGPFKGYESIQNSNVPLYGVSSTEDVKFCKFDKDNTLRHSGSLPHNNLSRAIYGVVPLDVDWDTNDAYGYCNEDNEPIVVTPLKQINDWWWGTWKYYGLAVYNGTTGDLDILTDSADIEEIPGPVYPMSLAAIQRAAIVASDGWWEFTFIKATGYETATQNSEVQLQRLDGESAYVTTLRPRGSSSSIVAVSEIDAGTAKTGTLNPLVIAEFPEKYYRAGNSTLVDNIRTTYSHLPVMANDSFQVYEITAGEEGEWVASMGREQSVNYRAYVSKDGKDIRLVDQYGNLVAQGNSAKPEEGKEGGGTVLNPTDLSTMTNDELKEISDLITEELVNRANATAE